MPKNHTVIDRVAKIFKAIDEDDYGELPNDWEMKFLGGQQNAYWELSDKQEVVMVQIEAKVFGKKTKGTDTGRAQETLFDKSTEGTLPTGYVDDDIDDVPF